ncbi:DUF3885 domain-containing protein [Alkalihalophilus pseudofirmus]|uniref:DUF3885 domain-containing protein n=1 Tax=Alkalihalophilus pseudofirmus TaxID=79885 RepID=A0AAJ2NLQ4_ALKPS|nr:DUF3885 domain-containing protein [Alkalihalophilus pseudofirmus]MDV2884658.1 DUF3885 domain-containing protein [Alkalihalophilus pseudofirmus]
MELNEYLAYSFPGLHLKPSLYNQWHIGIHFELGKNMYQLDGNKLNLDLFELVYSQATAIFNDLFSKQDEMMLVTNAYLHIGNKKIVKAPKVYKHFLKNNKLKHKIRQKTLPVMIDDEGDPSEYYISQFHLKCKKGDLNYPLLIKAICHKDFHLKPKLGKRKGAYDPDVFFVNISKNIIYYIYDDRGCEVIANSTETIVPLYNDYTEWVAGYNRDEIERMLHSL